MPQRLRWVIGTRALAREYALTWLAAVLAVVSVWPIVHASSVLALERLTARAPLAALASIGHVVLAGALVYGTLVYLAARLGHLARLRQAERDVRGVTPRRCPDPARLVALIPAYLEDPDVVRRAVLSAALQSHPRRRVVLLIDDPVSMPAPTPAAIRAVADEAAALLEEPRRRYAAALADFDARVRGNAFTPGPEAHRLADACESAAEWFTKQVHGGTLSAADAFFRDTIFRGPAARWWQEAQRWAAVARAPRASTTAEAVRTVYATLLATFTVDIASFERKRFANLSHAPNKAMNVNTYLGLLAGTYREDVRDGQRMLVRCPAAEADLVVPDADFVLILDADTIVTPDYATTLLEHFAAPGGELVAIVQCPYSTFPSQHGVLQRIAGAQTDIQYILHQGFTYYDATYWVGANAIARVSALRQLAVRGVERGFEIVKFVSDRTLIEDTETSIDLVSRGWTLYSHLDRLAFSMTPPDFGALLIQRQRWANGGLLIVPKLLRYLRRRRPLVAGLGEGLMRLQYLVALGPVSMALLIAVSVAWEERYRAGGLFVTGLIYYAVYARDLHLLGYRWYDVLRVVALNLLLIPVNLAGMVLSIRQALTGRKARFRRTPKVHGRTRVPAGFVVAEVALLVLWCATCARSVVTDNPVAAGLMAVHAVLAAYGILTFIGLRDAATDLVARASAAEGGAARS